MVLKKTVAVSLSVITVLGLFFEGSGTIEAKAKVKVKDISVAAPYTKQLNIAKGKKVKLVPVVNVVPDKQVNKKVKYKCNNEKIATISRKGVVKAKTVGSTKVVISSKLNPKKKVVVKVNVLKNAVKKIKLNKSSAVMKQGETITLNAKVTPTKNTNKSVIWSSSQKTIASVDNNGVVTAVSPGKTVIMASAADGSGKVSKCTVTVKQVTNIIKAEVIDSSTLSFTLDNNEIIDTSAISIQSRDTAEGQYIKEYSIKGLRTSDLTNYELCIDSDNELFINRQYIKLTVKTPSGDAVYEFKVQFRTKEAGLKERIITGNVGGFIGLKTVKFGNYVTGEASYTVSGLPDGLVSKVIDGDLYITGTPVAVSDNVIATATALDETGKATMRNIRILVGSDSTLVSYIKPMHLLSNKHYSHNNKLYIAGGSGNYNVDVSMDLGLTNTGSVRTAYEDGIVSVEVSSLNNSIYIPYGPQPVLPEGDYNIVCYITDKQLTSLTASKSLGITVRNGVSVTGLLTDASGVPIVGEFINADCVSTNDYDAISDFDFTFRSDRPTDSSGKYTIRVFEGQNYDIYGSYAKKYNQPVTTAGANIDMQSSYYKVTIPAIGNNSFLYNFHGNDDSINRDKAYDYTSYNLVKMDNPDQRIYVKNGNAYVLPGSYDLRNELTLDADSADGYVKGSFDMHVAFTVTNSDIIATPEVYDQYKGQLSLDVPVNITVEKYCDSCYCFIAPEDGEYKYTYDSVNCAVKFSTESGRINSNNMRQGERLYLYIENNNGRQAVVNGLKITRKY